MNISLKLISILILLTACGKQEPIVVDSRSETGKSCTASKADKKTTISCPDGSVVEVYDGENGAQGPQGVQGQIGVPGEDGATGAAGTNGTSCILSEVEDGAKITCADKTITIRNGIQGIQGIQGAQGETGTAGAQGEQGEKGNTGAVGTSCTVFQTTEGADIICGETKASVAHGEQGPTGPQGSQGIAGRDGTDGVDGKDGAPGLPGSSITPVIPCPNKSGSFPEVLLCIDNKLYAVFVETGSTKTVRYSQIPAGNYQTTDGRSCNFTVSNSCTLSY